MHRKIMPRLDMDRHAMHRHDKDRHDKDRHDTDRLAMHRLDKHRHGKARKNICSRIECDLWASMRATSGPIQSQLGGPHSVYDTTIVQ